MNETNQNKIWELAVSKLHGEGSESETNELHDLVLILEDAKISKTFSELHPKLVEATQPHYDSLIRYQVIHRHYFKSKKLRFYYTLLTDHAGNHYIAQTTFMKKF